MRSSVSVILSNPPLDTTMSYPDYNQSAEDHQCLLVIVKQIGNQLKQKTFNQLYERICRLQYVRVHQDNTQGSGSRGIWVCYKRSYPVENNEWGDFQAHRKVLGFISVGKCTNQDELESLCRAHEAAKEKYSSTIIDSRCIVVGYSPDMESPSGDSSVSVEEYSNTNPESPTDQTTFRSENSENCCGEPVDINLDPDSGVFSSPLLDGHDVDGGRLSTSANLHNGLSTAVRNVMDPASGDPIRPDVELKKRGHFRNISLPTSPIRAFVAAGGVPKNESLNFSLPPSPTCKRDHVPSSSSSSSIGSSQHNLVTVASLKSELLFYENMDDFPNLEKDLNEFISFLFYVLDSKRLDKSHEKLDRVPFLFAPCEKKDFVGLNLENRANKKRSLGRMKKHIGDLSLLAGLPVEAINYYFVAADILKSVNDWLWLAGCYEGLCAASAVTLYPRHQKKSMSLHRNLSFPVGASPNRPRPGSFSSHSLPNGMDPLEFKCKNCLSHDEIIDRYREAIVHYSKYHNATVIEMEANIKATKILILQEKYIMASEFIQNLVFVKGQQSDEEKVQRFICLSQLYTQIGFHRKAALFRRTAALKCVNSPNLDPNWTQAYYLLLQALDGYRLSLDPKQYSKDKGWPILQIQMLKDLIRISRRMGNAAVSGRHMTFLLHNLFDHLTPNERRDCCNQLSILISKCEAAPVPLVLDNGFILPAVNLTNLPCVKLFKPDNLTPHLWPLSMTIKEEDKHSSGPFIFSPLQFGHRKEKDLNSNMMDFKWVEGDACDVALHIYNPLACELKVSNMILLADGIPFETFPASLDLPAMSGPYPVNLVGTPRSSGTLEILGYSAHVFGVKSNCRLSDLPSIKKQSYAIEVIPALPQIQIITALPKAATFSSFGDTTTIVSSHTLSMYAGAVQECIITLVNSSKVNVEKVDMSLESKLEKPVESRFCTLDLESLQEDLPLEPLQSANFKAIVHAVGDFLALAKAYSEEGSLNSSNLTVPSKTTRTGSVGSTGGFTSSVRSTINYSSFRRKAADSQLPSPAVIPATKTYTPKVVEMMLKIRYSGGPGMAADYCRHSSVVINVEISPSILITKWDVLPAERPTHCYLVLDILNPTEHEMEVQYTENKKILIEAKETCRIPVPVERCPVSNFIGTSILLICLTALEVNGTASIANLVWSREMLDLIHMSPIMWEICLNDIVFNPECDLSFVLGEVINLTIAITNYSDSALSNLNLKVDCYQDYQNGQLNFRLENKMAFIGSDYFNIPVVNIQDTFKYTCGILFFVPGMYKVDIQCSSGPLSRRKSNAHEKHDSSLQTHTWKCMRAIEISIAQK
uniref:Uncharacterized protein n=1 Tax=Strigamia maritima TaxID=126957 RepID=T1J6X1_STRMM